MDHRGIVGFSITGALAKLQLARAEEMSANHELARRHYQDFFALWKEADPNIPILMQAKTEYAKLHQPAIPRQLARAAPFPPH